MSKCEAVASSNTIVVENVGRMTMIVLVAGGVVVMPVLSSYFLVRACVGQVGHRRNVKTDVDDFVEPQYAAKWWVWARDGVEGTVAILAGTADLDAFFETAKKLRGQSFVCCAVQKVGSVMEKVGSAYTGGRPPRRGAAIPRCYEHRVCREKVLENSLQLGDYWVFASVLNKRMPNL